MKIKIPTVPISLIFLILFSGQVLSLPRISGSAETTVYTFSSERDDFSDTKIKSRIHENIFLDIGFLDSLSFHTNNRISYWTSKSENPDQWETNLHYGYFDFVPFDFLNIQVGRIMDINSLMYAYYDGANIECIIDIPENKITIDIYGGLNVNDDYLEDENEPYGLNSYDYRNIFNFDGLSNYQDLLIQQRKGDYIEGARANLLAEGIGIFSVDYQSIYNHYKLAEHYLSYDFDTLFSKLFTFYGYGVLDLIEKTPSNTLASARINPIDLISVIIEHEYYRPVYIKDSYFWTYFEPYGYQEASGTLVLLISQLQTMDFRYSRLFYDSTSEKGDEYSIKYENRGIFNFGITFEGNYLTGPEGDQITSHSALRKRVFIIDFMISGGVILYNYYNLSHIAQTDYFSKNYNDIKDNFQKGYYGTLGADMSILKNLTISASGEYYNNPKYYYDVRGIFSLKYFF